MPPPPIRRPKSFELAAARYLATETDFPSRFRRDHEARCWRRWDEDSSSWQRVSELSEITYAVSETLLPVLDDDELPPPFLFSLVYAPLDIVWRKDRTIRDNADRPWEAADMDAAPLTLTDLEQCSSWFEAWERARAVWGRSPSQIVGPRQRVRLARDAESARAARRVLEALSAAPEFRYVARADHERAFLDSLVSDPSAVTPTSWVHRAYVDSLPEGVEPMHPRPFRRLVVDRFGEPRHTNRGDVYTGLALPSSPAARSA